MMDVQWFKQQQKRAGATTEDIAQAAGRTRTAVSNIYTGQQRMNLHWAQAFATVLGVPLDEVLRRAGVTDDATSRQLASGFAEGDAAPLAPLRSDAPGQPIIEIARAFGMGPGIDVWQVRTGSMALQGLLVGDVMLVDTNQADTARSGDIVIAQVYDNARGIATTVLRRLEPPVLVAASCAADERRVLVVDGVNVAVRGKVVATWRAL